MHRSTGKSLSSVNRHSAREHIERRYSSTEEADSADWILSLDEAVSMGIKRFLIFARVSHRNQLQSGTYSHQIEKLIKVCDRRGLDWKTYSKGPIHESAKQLHFGSTIAKASRAAKISGRAILALSVDRLVRNSRFQATSSEPLAPTVGDMNRLSDIVGNVPLVTVLSPDADPFEIRSERIRRGLGHSGAKLIAKRGPRFTKAEREALATNAHHLQQTGLSNRQMALMLGVSAPTVAALISLDEV